MTTTAATTPSYISLNRLARLTGKSRITLLLRLKDGNLPPDAMLDCGNGKPLPLYLPERAAQFKRAPAPAMDPDMPEPPVATTPAPHPML